MQSRSLSPRWSATVVAFARQAITCTVFIAIAAVGLASIAPAPEWLRVFQTAPPPSEDGFQPGENRTLDFDLVVTTSFFSTQTHATRRGTFGGRSVQFSLRPLPSGVDIAVGPGPLSPTSLANRFGLSGSARSAVMANPALSAAACFYLRASSYGFPLRAVTITTIEPFNGAVSSPPRPALRLHWSGLAVDVSLLGMPWLLVARLFVALRSRRRRAAGLCLSCGHQLAQAQKRCPECASAT